MVHTTRLDCAPAEVAGFDEEHMLAVQEPFGQEDGPEQPGLDSTAIALWEEAEGAQPGFDVPPWAEALRDNWARRRTVAGIILSHGRL